PGDGRPRFAAKEAGSPEECRQRNLSKVSVGSVSCGTGDFQAGTSTSGSLALIRRGIHGIVGASVEGAVAGDVSMLAVSDSKSFRPVAFAVVLCLGMLVGDVCEEFLGWHNPLSLMFYTSLPVVFWQIVEEHKRHSRNIRSLEARIEGLENSLRASRQDAHVSPRDIQLVG
ncbi:MAG: hypothetical protein ACKOCN_04205, partial [Planctomycetaceae bacterium]